MAEAMRGALSLTTSGFAYASHDIGGFEVRGYDSMQEIRPLTYCWAGPPTSRDLPTMGCVWTVLYAQSTTRLIVLPSTMELRRRCCEEYGENAECKAPVDALYLWNGKTRVDAADEQNEANAHISRLQPMSRAIP